MVAQRLGAIAQAGTGYHSSGYDLERYQELRNLAATLLENLSDESHEKIVRVPARYDIVSGNDLRLAVGIDGCNLGYNCEN